METAWRVFFNAQSRHGGDPPVRIEGDAALARPLLQARAVIV